MSPSSCGISCVATASAVLTPSGIDVRTAVPMTTPSRKLWKASPMITIGAAMPCASQSCVWQCRHSTSFSSRKNSMMPASSEPSTARGGEMRERFRKQHEQRDAEQRADGVADEPRHELDAKTIVEEEKR